MPGYRYPKEIIVNDLMMHLGTVCMFNSKCLTQGQNSRYAILSTGLPLRVARKVIDVDGGNLSWNGKFSDKQELDAKRCSVHRPHSAWLQLPNAEELAALGKQ